MEAPLFRLPTSAHPGAGAQMPSTSCNGVHVVSSEGSKPQNTFQLLMQMFACRDRRAQLRYVSQYGVFYLPI